MAIVCGYKDAIDHDRLRHDPAVARWIALSLRTIAPLFVAHPVTSLE
jgi:hypothetical protein